MLVNTIPILCHIRQDLWYNFNTKDNDTKGTDITTNGKLVCYTFYFLPIWKQYLPSIITLSVRVIFTADIIPF